MGTLGGAHSEAKDINNSGQIVGSSWIETANGNTLQRAVIWDGGEILDLNDLVVGLGEWALDDATAIDDRGRIIVTAFRPGESRAVLLTPHGSRCRMAE